MGFRWPAWDEFTFGHPSAATPRRKMLNNGNLQLPENPSRRKNWPYCKNFLARSLSGQMDRRCAIAPSPGVFIGVRAES